MPPRLISHRRSDHSRRTVLMDDSAVLSSDRTARLHSGTIQQRRRLALTDDRTVLTNVGGTLSNDRTTRTHVRPILQRCRPSLSDDRTILHQRGLIRSNDQTILPNNRTILMNDRLSLMDDGTILHPCKPGKTPRRSAESFVLAQNDRFLADSRRAGAFHDDSAKMGTAFTRPTFSSATFSPKMIIADKLTRSVMIHMFGQPQNPTR